MWEQNVLNTFSKIVVKHLKPDARTNMVQNTHVKFAELQSELHERVQYITCRYTQ